MRVACSNTHTYTHMYTHPHVHTLTHTHAHMTSNYSIMSFTVFMLTEKEVKRKFISIGV